MFGSRMHNKDFHNHFSPNHWSMFFDKARMGHERGFNFHHQENLDSNSLSFLLLYIISEKPSYGYELIKTIETMFDKTYSPEPEDIYPNLAKSEDMGFLSSQTENGKKIYSITEEGKAYLDDNKEKTTKIFATIESFKNSINGDDIKKVFSYVKGIGSYIVSAYRENTWNREHIKKLLVILERTAKEIKEI